MNKLNFGVALVTAALYGLTSVSQAQPQEPNRVGKSSVVHAHLDATESDSIVVSLDRPRQHLAQGVAASGFRIEAFPLTASFRVSLDIKPFKITNEKTQFVLVDANGADRPLDFDPDSLTLLRGTVAGAAGSSVYLALGENRAFGTIDLGALGESYTVTSAGGESLAVSRAPLNAVGGLDVPMCGLDTSKVELPVRTSTTRRGASVSTATRIQLAVETDYELRTLFESLDDEAAYIVALYGAVSDIYLRDVDAHVVLTFVRLWDTPKDLFNEPSPLRPFRDYWLENMGEVERDVAQYLSGRRDLPWGGVAYFNTLCNPKRGYSVSGYTLGDYPEGGAPSVFNRDIIIAAHEIGHSCGAPHAHSIGVDTCADPKTDPRRGGIMSYCGQTFTGGDANHDLRFHTAIQALMDIAIAESACLVADCNLNGIDDAIDIAEATSLDVNENGVPDECEDCNNNGVLDDQDIATAFSLDLNLNGVPDECEPDCNSNGIPDDKDIADETSFDDNGDGVPDECETDCNDNGFSDYLEIQADMSLDLDRNALLDACQDCDNDGTTDLAAIDGANDIWIATLEGTGVRRYLSVTGTQVLLSDDGVIDEGMDVLVLPDRRVLVSSKGTDSVVAFDADGAWLGDLVAPGSGGLDEPAGLLLAPDGTLLVASRATNEVLQFDTTTGSPLGALVAAGDGGLIAPFGMTFGPDGDLFVTSEAGEVLRYDATTGAFISTFVSMNDNGGLAEPRGLVFLPSGELIVASHGSNAVLRYDGATGAFINKFNQNGTETVMTLDQPWGVRLGPDGNVYVSRAHDHVDEPKPDGMLLHLTNARIYIFHPESGFMIRAYIQGVNSGIEHATGFDFLPGGNDDCNQNLIPDSCDIADGTSADSNDNGVPDECEVTDEPGCPADLALPFGILDFFDVQAFLSAFAAEEVPGDFNSDGKFDFFDVQSFLNAYAIGCP